MSDIGDFVNVLPNIVTAPVVIRPGINISSMAVNKNANGVLTGTCVGFSRTCLNLKIAAMIKHQPDTNDSPSSISMTKVAPPVNRMAMQPRLNAFSLPEAQFKLLACAHSDINSGNNSVVSRCMFKRFIISILSLFFLHANRLWSILEVYETK